MKNKKLLTLVSAGLCTVLFASCSGGSSTTFSANWYANTSTNTVVEGTNETLTYSVSMKEESSSNTSYSIFYTDGSYTTTLTAETKDGELVYSYQTKLTISVQYTYESEVSEKFKDVVTSKVLFKNTKSGLQPLRSEKNVESHSPTQSSSSLLGCYTYYKYSFVIDYENNCTSGKTTFTDLSKEEPVEKKRDFSIGDKYTYIDNEELLFAFRGVSLASAQQVQTYNASTKSVQPVKLSPSSSETEEFNFVMNGKEGKKAIEYYPVSISIVDEYPGATQTAWYAKPSDKSSSNTYRNVLLRLETPIFYNLGTLVYELKTADFTSV